MKMNGRPLQASQLLQYTNGAFISYHRKHVRCLASYANTAHNKPGDSEGRGRNSRSGEEGIQSRGAGQNAADETREGPLTGVIQMHCNA